MNINKNSRRPSNPAAADEAFGLNFDDLPMPTNDLVMLEQIKEVTSALVAIPESVNEKSNRFVVISKGPGRHTDAGAVIHPPCEIGDVVYANINPGNALAFKKDGRQFFLVQGLNIMGIFPKSQPESGLE